MAPADTASAAAAFIFPLFILDTYLRTLKCFFFPWTVELFSAKHTDRQSGTFKWRKSVKRRRQPGGHFLLLAPEFQAFALQCTSFHCQVKRRRGGNNTIECTVSSSSAEPQVKQWTMIKAANCAKPGLAAAAKTCHLSHLCSFPLPAWLGLLSEFRSHSLSVCLFEFSFSIWVLCSSSLAFDVIVHSRIASLAG